jgi:hypothetical protein
MAVQIGVNVREDGDDNINKTIARVYWIGRQLNLT